MSAHSAHSPRLSVGVLMSALIAVIGVWLLHPTQAATPNPSGLFMPTTDEAGWKLVGNDDFSGASLDTSKWTIRTDGKNTSSNVVVGGGMLDLLTSKSNGSWYTAAITGAKFVHQRDGKYLVRLRIDKAAGTGGVVSLVPYQDCSPPEIRLFDASEALPGRTVSKAGNYYRANQGSCNGTESHIDNVGADFSQWHTVGIEWKDESLKYTLDGRVVGSENSNVPERQMVLNIAASIGKNGAAPDKTTPNVVHYQLDWIAVFAPSASATGGSTGGSTGGGTGSGSSGGSQGSSGGGSSSGHTGSGGATSPGGSATGATGSGSASGGPQTGVSGSTGSSTVTHVPKPANALGLDTSKGRESFPRQIFGHGVPHMLRLLAPYIIGLLLFLLFLLWYRRRRKAQEEEELRDPDEVPDTLLEDVQAGYPGETPVLPEPPADQQHTDSSRYPW